MGKVMIVPKGTEEFRCIGTACEDHCCNSWRVDIDRVGFMKVTTSSNSVIKPLAKKAYVKNQNATNDSNYGLMQWNSERLCHFLDENKWCIIHKELGESALCNTCAIYPREHRQVGEYVEKSLSLSCPEVVRTLLLQVEGLEFEEVLAQSNERFINKAFVKAEAVDFIWKVRIFAINLLQERSIPLDIRMLLLGVFMEQVNKKTQTLENIEQVILKMEQRISMPEYLQAILNVKGNELVQLQLHKELIRTTIEEISFNPRFVNVVNQFIRGLQTGPLEEKEITEETLKAYMDAQAPYQQFMKQHPYILENYIVHYIFTNIFPLNAENSFEAYEDIVINYQVIKALLIGVAAQNGELTVDDAILVIQSYSKVAAHSSKSYITLRQKIKESGLESMPFLFTYIKTNE